jgi:ATP-dependent RNA helicase DDX51/DBP6
LKRKKDRRKNRKSKKLNEPLPATQQREEQDSYTSSSQDSDTNECYGNDSEAEVVEKPITKINVAEGAKRPKKRPKIADEGDMEMANLPQSNIVNFESGEQPFQPITHRSSPLATLPSFPLPALPNVPPKSVLALQGLDQALIDADIVDSTTLLRIPPDGDDDAGTGLTEKTRRRLKELGITELFAGLHPFHCLWLALIC